MKSINKYLFKQEIKSTITNKFYKLSNFQFLDSLKNFVSNKLNKGLLIESNKNLKLQKKNSKKNEKTEKIVKDSTLQSQPEKSPVVKSK
jgi:hypothetical protein